MTPFLVARQRQKHLRTFLASLTILLSFVLISSPATAADSFASSPAFLLDLQPDLKTSVSAKTAASDHYRIDVTFDPDEGALTGSEQVEVLNSTGRTLTSIVFQLPTNYEWTSYSTRTRISGVSVDRQSVDEISKNIGVLGTILDIPLVGGLRAGETVELEIEFTTSIRPDGGVYGGAGHDWTTETWAYADWFPVVASYDAETGWIKRGVSSSFERGDKLDFYDVTIVSPPDYSIVATGSEISANAQQGGVVHRFMAGPVRGFALALDTDFVQVSTTVSGTNINVAIDTYFAGIESTALQFAEAAFRDYSSHYGNYPFSRVGHHHHNRQFRCRLRLSGSRLCLASFG
jgi:hypothetical protein